MKVNLIFIEFPKFEQIWNFDQYFEFGLNFDLDANFDFDQNFDCHQRNCDFLPIFLFAPKLWFLIKIYIFDNFGFRIFKNQIRKIKGNILNFGQT